MCSLTSDCLQNGLFPKRRDVCPTVSEGDCCGAFHRLMDFPSIHWRSNNQRVLPFKCCSPVELSGGAWNKKSAIDWYRTLRTGGITLFLCLFTANAFEVRPSAGVRLHRRSRALIETWRADRSVATMNSGFRYAFWAGVAKAVQSREVAAQSELRPLELHGSTPCIMWMDNSIQSHLRFK